MASSSMSGVLAGILTACGAAGTQPHDMAAAQHGATAETLEKSAVEHAHRSDPGGGTTTCGGSTIEGTSPCWSVPSNQAAHEQEARRLHELAKRHRAAGDALIQAERDACAGLAEADRDVSPFIYHDDITSVTRLSETQAEPARIGVVIRFRPVEGLTIGWLERAVQCHIARSAVLGHSAELGYCPLAVRGASAKVAANASGLAVEVWATDPAGGAEILGRAQKLLASDP